MKGFKEGGEEAARTSAPKEEPQIGGQKVPLGELLISKGLISRDQLEKALDYQKEVQVYLGRILQDLGFVSETQIIEALSSQLDDIITDDPTALGGRHIPTEEELEIDPVAVKAIPLTTAIKHRIMPLRVDSQKKKLTIAALDIRDPKVFDQLRFSTGFGVEPIQVDQQFLTEAWLKHYGWTEPVRTLEIPNMDFKTFGGGAKISEQNIHPFINKILAKAAELKASDIHIDPFKNDVHVRYRIDGRLYQVVSFAKSSYPQFLGKLRVMANVDLNDRRNAIDARMSVQVGDDKTREYRVSILQSLFGERVVLRIQRDSQEIPRLSSIGLPKLYAELLRDRLRRPHGMIIVTGPTGSGKTTTLYAMLAELSDFTRNVLTIEDPIELTLPGASPILVDPERGLSFSSILRSALRQDPDVIMVGEIRDEETAQIAVRAAMTGHLVMASLHTNDAISSITRLQDMGIAPYYLGPALNVVIAQRLVRLLCDHCKQPDRPNRLFLLELGYTPTQIRETIFHKSVGCNRCNMTGYRGRVPIFEVISVNSKLKDAISKGEPGSKLALLARKNKYVPFLALLREYLKRGKTSIEEALPYLLEV